MPLCFVLVTYVCQAQDIVEVLHNKYQNIPEFRVTFDVFSRLGESKKRQVTITEGYGRKSTYCRVIHWYDDRFFKLLSPRDDLLLNSYYWSAGYSYRFFENTRILRVDRGTYEDDGETPSIERYTGYFGLLSAERRLSRQFNDSNDPFPGKYSAKKYYLECALLHRDRWIVQVLDQERTILTSSCDEYIDTLELRSPDLLLERRKIEDLRRHTKLTLNFLDYRDVGNGFQLPMRIVVEGRASTPEELSVTEFGLGFPAGVAHPTVPAGCIVRDIGASQTRFTPGGTELLDDAIEIMRRSMKE